MFRCDAFYDVRDIKTKRCASIGYGERSGDLTLRRDSPPPNIYNIPSDFSKRKPNSRAFSFGISRDYFKRVYYKENPPVDTSLPGPGTY